MYAQMNTGISAEFVQFYPGKDFDIGRGAPHYLLRPETVESFFVLYQLTGDPVYREWGWEVFQAIERYCKAAAGYGSLRDVQNTDAAPQNKMESFFLAETLKYLYLLFDPDTEVDVLNKVSFITSKVTKIILSRQTQRLRFLIVSVFTSMCLILRPTRYGHLRPWMRPVYRIS